MYEGLQMLLLHAVFRNLIGEGNMACLRLDDEKEFY